MMAAPTCAKCDNAAKIHLGDKPRCHPCFTDYLQRTFKTSIGRLGAGGRRTIAVALSCGESSATAALLVHQYHTSLHPNPHAPIPHIVLIHIPINSPSNPPSPPPPVAAIHAAIPTSSLAVAALPAQTTEALSRLTDDTDRLDLTIQAVHNKLAATASDNNCDTVILGTSASRTAATILHSLSTGRGSKVPHDAAASFMLGGIRFIRPLRHIPIRLLVRYARLVLPADTPFASPSSHTLQRNAKPTAELSSSSARPAAAGSNRSTALLPVIERFVSAVADDNASSVHNVVRVAERLGHAQGRVCHMCGLPVGNNDSAAVSSGGDCDGGGECGHCESADTMVLCQSCSGCVSRADVGGEDRVGSNAVLDVLQLSLPDKEHCLRSDVRSTGH